MAILKHEEGGNRKFQIDITGGENGK